MSIKWPLVVLAYMVAFYAAVWTFNFFSAWLGIAIAAITVFILINHILKQTK